MNQIKDLEFVLLFIIYQHLPLVIDFNQMQIHRL